MTEKEKQLLLKDLCARLPYGVKVQYNNEIYNIDYISALYEEVKLDIPDNYTIGISEIKPYLRPMSSMTKDEVKEYEHTMIPLGYYDGYTIDTFDWLNRHHFDYRGLTEKGLALEAPNNMYKEEQK
jgi:hypothetical protein